MATHTERPGAGLGPFFHARSIAVVGASDDITKIGGRPVYMLRKHGYAGAVYPVNPKRHQVHGVRCYPDLASVPEVPDLALIA